jgi:transposase
MASPKTFIITETLAEIKTFIKKSQPFIAKRLQALLLFKKHEHTGVSKRVVAASLGVDHNSIQTWRSLYIEGGIEKLMEHSKKGNRKSVITPAQNQTLKAVLHNPKNGIVGYVELLDWFNTEHKTDINYKTFHGYVVRKFQSKIKVARKSHDKKDPEAVEAFKKTLVANAEKLQRKKPKATKQ